LKLTDRQKEILAFIIKHQRQRNPTVRTIAKHFHIAVSTVHEHLQAIRKKGYLAEK